MCIRDSTVGFLDVINWENRTILTLRLLPDGTLESYNSDLMKFRKVQEWSENPDPVEDLESAEESGLVF